MKTFAFASVATIAAATNFRILNEGKAEWEEWDEMKDWEKLFACSLTTGSIGFALCPESPEDCDEQIQNFFDTLDEQGLTHDEKKFWKTCAEIFAEPESECDQFLAEGSCAPDEPIEKCIEKAFTTDEHLDDHD